MLKKTEVETIVVKVDIPPDGTYPPRIVKDGETLWVKEDDPVDLFEGNPIYFENGSCKIRMEQDIGIHVNGMPLIAPYRLKDGDYISLMDLHVIFQADPCKDHRKYWETNEAPKETTITLTGRLRHVRIDKKGISFDDGRNTSPWDDISSIGFVQVRKKRYVNINNMNGFMPSKLKDVALSEREITELLNWIEYAAPYHISLLNFTYMDLPDAYPDLVLTKIIEPARAGFRELPEPVKTMLGILDSRQTVKKIIWDLVSWIGMSIGISFLLMLRDDVDFSVATLLIMASIWALLFSPFTTGYLWQLIRHLRELPEINKKYEIE